MQREESGKKKRGSLWGRKRGRLTGGVRGPRKSCTSLTGGVRGKKSHLNIAARVQKRPGKDRLGHRGACSVYG